MQRGWGEKNSLLTGRTTVSAVLDFIRDFGQRLGRKKTEEAGGQEKEKKNSQKRLGSGIWFE